MSNRLVLLDSDVIDSLVELLNECQFRRVPTDAAASDAFSVCMNCNGAEDDHADDCWVGRAMSALKNWDDEPRPMRHMPTQCGYCEYDEAEGDLIVQCPKCIAADAAKQEAA